MRSGAWLVVLAMGCGVATVEDAEPEPPEAGRAYSLPEHVIVRPVFFSAADQPLASADQEARLMRHLAWAQQRYAEMLGEDTFDFATVAPTVVRGARALGDYLKLADYGASEIMAELLAYVQRTRFNNPYIFVTVVMNAAGSEPGGYGRPCNGGLDGGGGLLIVSSATLESRTFQSTLQHELGHAFGLPHVDAYNYDMDTSTSIMSYNVAHWTDGFEPSPTPGSMIPEDLHALAMNQRVFSALAFDPARDVPPGYTLAPVVPIPAMEVPGQPPNAVAATTSSGELYDTAVSNVVQGRLEPSRGPGITFDAAAMWHSDVASTGEVSVDLEFPIVVSLDEIRVHTQHSGLYHAAVAVRVEAQPADSDYVQVASQPIAIDDRVPFPVTSSRRWRVALRAGASEMVVVRGLQFFVDGGEVFPPFVPEP